MSDVCFNDKWLSGCGATVEYRPPRSIPKRDYSVAAVPGRNGSLLYDGGKWQDVTQPYQIYTRGGYIEAFEKLAAWMYSDTGWRQLYDTYDPKHYRMAYVSDAPSLDDIWDNWGRGTITFTCMPQRWLFEGDEPIDVIHGDVLKNPTAFASRPIIKVTGSGMLTIGDTQVTLTNIPETGITIDCEMRECYGINQTNLNDHVTMAAWPELGKSTAFNIGAGIESVEVTPKWWTI